MRAEELLKTMVQSFFIITTGIIISMYVFCLIFYPDASFSLDDIGRILLMALAGDLPHVIFLSRRELNKMQMLIRKIIHLIVLSAVLLYFASLWDWVSLHSSKEVAVFLSSVLVVYVAVFLATHYRDKKLTDKMNERLNEHYHS
ncbi:MAG: hypothetical protein H6Q64_991 [Firmicutes bacterium]|nr:hypothetical protein [Bacillota bacterium]